MHRRRELRLCTGWPTSNGGGLQTTAEPERQCGVGGAELPRPLHVRYGQPPCDVWEAWPGRCGPAVSLPLRRESHAKAGRLWSVTHHLRWHGCMYAGTTSDSASASPFARLGGSPAGARPCSPVGAGSVDSVQARTGYLPTSVIGPSSGVPRTPSDGEAVDAGKIISLSDDQTLRRRRHAGQRTACRTRTAWPARTAPPRADSAPCRTARHRPTQRGARPLRRRT